MNKIMCTWKGMAGEKIKKFEERVKRDKRCGEEADLFFAAVEAMNQYRNFAVHSHISMSKDAIYTRKLRLVSPPTNFEILAQRYDRPFKLPALPFDAPMDERTFVKRQFCIAHMALAWIVEYSEISTKIP